ncbi:MAG: hypothetical protein Q8906_07790 [Bacillota bacterium]|nr:hypothetical protein [Bacillota bacterium]
MIYSLNRLPLVKNTLLIGAEGAKTPEGVRVRGDPAGAKRGGGSPARPRKAKHLERKSTDLFKEVFTNNITTY